jgi:hypothetical protein
VAGGSEVVYGEGDVERGEGQGAISEVLPDFI